MIGAGCTDQQQIRGLFQSCAAHTTGNVFIQPQQAAGGHSQLGTDALRRAEASTRCGNSPVQATAHFFEAGIHHRQGKQQPFSPRRSLHQAGRHAQQPLLSAGVGHRHHDAQGALHHLIDAVQHRRLLTEADRHRVGTGILEPCHRLLREDRPQGGRHHHHRQHTVQHSLIEQTRLVADESRGQGRRHLGHRQRPHHQDLGAAITEQPSAQPGRQTLAADSAHQHQRGELKVGQALAEAAQIQQQSKVDEEDRDEQHATHKNHLFLHPALGQHGIHRKTSQEGADNLLDAGQLSPQGGQEQGHQNSEHHPVFIADAPQHQAPAQPADADHHHQSKATDLEQQQAQAQAAEAALAQPQSHRQQEQGHDVGEDRAANAHHHRLVLLGAVTAHDRIAQGGVSGHQGAEQQARNRGEARHQADRHTRTHTDQQDQQAIDERAALDPVELLEVNLQTHREQQIHRPEIGEQPYRFAAAVDPVQSVRTHHHASR